eukprot:1911649-Alexandrium_andersonii.AAC.1
MPGRARPPRSYAAQAAQRQRLAALLRSTSGLRGWHSVAHDSRNLAWPVKTQRSPQTRLWSAMTAFRSTYRAPRRAEAWLLEGARLTLERRRR